MIYRHFIHIALLVMAVMMTTACSQSSDDSVPENTEPAEAAAIGFRAELSKPTTRATGTGGGEMTDADLWASGFGVFCWYTGHADFTTPKPVSARTGSSEPYTMMMNNQKVEYVSSKWIYSPSKYWPLDPAEKMTFRAYAPYTNYLVTDEGTGMPMLPVVVASTDYHNNSQHDPLWGTGKLVDPSTNEYTGNGQYGSLYNNITYEMSGNNRLAATVPADTRNGIVDWYFHHGMAKIVIYAKMSDLGYTAPVTIKSIKLENLYDHGLLDISSLAGKTETEDEPPVVTHDKPTWDDRSGDMTVTLNSEDLSATTVGKDSWTRLTGTDSTDDKGLLIIPRDFGTGNKLKLSVTFVTSNDLEVTMSTEITEHFYGNTVYKFNMTVSNALSVEIQSINAAFTNWNEREANHEVYNW